jgi:hypothetical protein
MHAHTKGPAHLDRIRYIEQQRRSPLRIAPASLGSCRRGKEGRARGEGSLLGDQGRRRRARRGRRAWERGRDGGRAGSSRRGCSLGDG